MLQKEFEQLTGIKVSEEDFEKINEMCIEAGNMDKKSFCEAYKKGDFLSVVPTVIETVKRTANFEGYQEGQDEIHDLKMQIAANRCKSLQRMRLSVKRTNYFKHNLKILKKLSRNT
jgi:hypothetical protein